jgi:hypothetical protein
MNDNIIKPRTSLVTSVQETHPNYTRTIGPRYKRSHAGISYRSVDSTVHSRYSFNLRVYLLNTVPKSSLRITSYRLLSANTAFSSLKNCIRTAGNLRTLLTPQPNEGELARRGSVLFRVIGNCSVLPADYSYLRRKIKYTAFS